MRSQSLTGDLDLQLQLGRDFDLLLHGAEQSRAGTRQALYVSYSSSVGASD